MMENTSTGTSRAGRSVGATSSTPARDLSDIIPMLQDHPGLTLRIPEIINIVEDLGIGYEILIVTSELGSETLKAAESAGATVILQEERGYGGALIAAFKAANGAYLLTMDADSSHQPKFIRDLWSNRHTADVLVASRYVAGGSAAMSKGRAFLSRLLNA